MVISPAPAHLARSSSRLGGWHDVRLGGGVEPLASLLAVSFRYSRVSRAQARQLGFSASTRGSFGGRQDCLDLASGEQAVLVVLVDAEHF